MNAVKIEKFIEALFEVAVKIEITTAAFFADEGQLLIRRVYRIEKPGNFIRQQAGNDDFSLLVMRTEDGGDPPKQVDETEVPKNNVVGTAHDHDAVRRLTGQIGGKAIE